MYNKIIISLVIFMLLLLTGTVFIYSLDAYYKSINFEKITFEEALKNKSIKTRLGVGNIHTPKDLALSYRTIQFNSFDGTPLEAWYIPALKSSKKCIIISHDIQSNRLESIKFLKAIKDVALLEEYHVFIPDLRNAGASGKSATYMGYKIAEDIVTSMTLVNQKFDIETFTLFGIGVGATASAIALKRPDLHKHLDDLNIKINALILDSPISHVGKTLTEKHKTIANPLAAAVCYYFNNDVKGYLDRMKLGFLLNKTDYDVLVLQNIGDEITPTPNLLEEIRNLPDVQLELFDGVQHGSMILHPSYKNRYMQTIATILQEKPILKEIQN